MGGPSNPLDLLPAFADPVPSENHSVGLSSHHKGWDHSMLFLVYTCVYVHIYKTADNLFLFIN